LLLGYCGEREGGTGLEVAGIEVESERLLEVRLDYTRELGELMTGYC